MNIVKGIFLIISMSLIFPAMSFGELTEAQIVAKAYDLYRSAVFEVEDIGVQVVSGSTVKKKAFVRYTAFDPAGNDTSSLKFYESRRDKETVVLIKDRDGERNLWMRRPSEKRLRLLKTNDSTYVAQTDLTTEDIRLLLREDTGLYIYELKQENGGRKIIMARPKDKGSSNYSYRMLEVGPGFVIHSIGFYRNGKLVKTLTNYEIVQDEDGPWRANKIVVQNDELDRSTTLTTKSREFRGQIDERAFSDSFLLGERERL